jgi:hypothetical protein
MTYMTRARVAVANGVQLLDTKVPGWDREIDLDTLVMHDPCRCILGQLREDGELYRDVKARLGINPMDDDSERGFDIPAWDPDEDHDEVTYEELCELWTDVILARR